MLHCDAKEIFQPQFQAIREGKRGKKRKRRGEREKRKGEREGKREKREEWEKKNLQ